VRRAAIWMVLLFSLALVSVAQEHGGEAAKEAHHEAPEPDMIGWKWANFAILAGALGFLAVKHGGPFFASRSVEIRKGIEDAQKMRADSEAKAAEMDKRLANLGMEVEAMRKAAKDEAAQEGARIRQETERELAKIQTNADHEIANALKTAQIELKSYSAQLAVDLARKKVREKMTPTDQDSLVQAFTADLGGGPK
jgi:F-type H+-transporting ATPase subunit b